MKVFPKFQEENEYSSISFHQQLISTDQGIEDFRHNYYFLHLPFLPFQPFSSLWQILIIVASLLMSIMGLLIKLITISCLQLLFLRSIYCLILLSLLTYLYQTNISQSISQDRDHRRLILFLSLLWILYQLLAIKSFQLLPLSLAFTLQSLTPLFAVIFALRFTTTNIIICFAALAGIALLITKESTPGIIVGVCAALASTISAEVIKNVGIIVHPITLVVFGNFGAVLLSFIGDFIFHGIDIPTQVNITTIAVIAVCFFVAQLVGIKAWEYQSIQQQQQQLLTATTQQEMLNQNQQQETPGDIKTYFQQISQQMVEGINQLGQGIQNFLQIIFGIIIDCALLHDFSYNIWIIVAILLISLSCLFLAFRFRKQ